MGHATRPDYLLGIKFVVTRVAAAWQDACTFSKEVCRTVLFSAHLKVEDDRTVRAAVLKLISPDGCAFWFLRFARRWALVRLDVTACEQIGFQGFHHGDEQSPAVMIGPLSASRGKIHCEILIYVCVLTVNGPLRGRIA